MEVVLFIGSWMWGVLVIAAIVANFKWFHEDENKILAYIIAAFWPIAIPIGVMAGCAFVGWEFGDWVRRSRTQNTAIDAKSGPGGYRNPTAPTTRPPRTEPRDYLGPGDVEKPKDLPPPSSSKGGE